MAVPGTLARVQCRAIRLSLFVAFLFFASGCASRASKSPGGAFPSPYAAESASDSPAAQPGSMPVMASRPAPASMPGASPRGANDQAAGPSSKGKRDGADKGAPSDDASSAPLLVYVATLALLVEPTTYESTIDRAIELASQFGGYVSNHNDRTVTVRIPSNRFRDAMRELEKLGALLSRAVQAEDITEEFHDLDVRLKTLQATRKRLEELLQKAANIHEVLEVEEQLARVTGEIDRSEGRLRFLQSHASLSTITVTLAPKTPASLTSLAPLPPRTVPLPIGWFSSLGIHRLLELSR